MVVGAFPAFKLGALLLKQASKPIANYVKKKAKDSLFFRTYICMPPAQFYNWCEVKAKMWILNLGKPVNVPSLNEAMAIELGANLLGEGVIFIIATGILYAEYARQSRKEVAKEAARTEEISRLNMILEDLYFQSEKQDAQIRELMRNVHDLQARVVQKPWIGRKEPPPPPRSPPPKLPLPDLEELPPVPQNDSSEGKSDKKNNKENCDGVILQALNYIQHEVRGRQHYHHISAEW